MSRRATQSSRTRRTSPKDSTTTVGRPIPDRGLKIGEAAELLGVKPYVLRFWETEFSQLRPAHTHSRHRYYTAKDIELLRLIKRLLHEERFTIEGARKRIKEQQNATDSNATPSYMAPGRSNAINDAANSPDHRLLDEVAQELREIRELLKD